MTDAWFYHIAVVRPRNEFRPRSLLARKIGEPHRGVKETGIRRSPDRGISVVTGTPFISLNRRASPKMVMLGQTMPSGKEICEIRFDRTVWSVERARRWLEWGDIPTVAFHEAQATEGEM